MFNLLKMDQNEYKFAKDIVNLDYKISKTLEYVQENFGVKAEYDDEEHIIKLTTNNVNEGLQLIAAKEYIDNNFEDGFITTNIG